MSDKAISIYDGDKFEVMARTAQAMAQSGFFTDARDVSKAMVKVLAGRELGLGPFASMTGIHIIQGRPAMGANLIATLIKNDPRYDYRVAELTDDICTIVFFEGGQPVGESTFTRADARRAGTKNLDKFPRNMLFARAISNGARWYTPGIFGGTVVYTPEELGADTDADGAVIDWQPAASNGHQPPPPADDEIVIDADELQALADAHDADPSGPSYADGSPVNTANEAEMATYSAYLDANHGTVPANRQALRAWWKRASVEEEE